MKLLEPEYITTHTILLAGVANLSDQKRILYNSIGNWKGGYDRNAWFAKLALARMGDEEQVKSCIIAIENEKDTDYRMLLMEYIAFMRQPQAFDILVKYLFSEMKTDTSGTVCSMSIKHAYSILPYLVSGIKNFPIEEKESYTEEDLLVARNWIKINANYAIIR